ncbi:hypothetical protein FW774_16685 [Pedobacter sp. BS3]|uniref:DinB family protein n=1 Tax=Pedobacter sp. BS3 TaxID=2567937 RepID=UPI0011EBA1D6|nr:DinB family protein [Pedobacter sp. BS3]TZF81691.1 hypothetical protein FW774_16685 [Pedobacter sp. BS3]
MQSFRDKLDDLLNYTFIADKRIISVFESMTSPIPQAEALFSHVLNSQHIWVKRMQYEPQEYERFQHHSVSNFRQIQAENASLLRYCLDTYPLETRVSYANSQGEEFTDAVGDILFHVINHSTYHRAQIASIFRKGGYQPPVTDYIFMKREGLL